MASREWEWARRKSLALCAALTLSALFVTTRAQADVTSPLPGVFLVREGSAAMTITNLCAAGVSVRATKYAEREATPQQWAQSVGAQVAINADFFDFPGWSYILVRARGDGEEWPASAEKLEQPSSYWYFGRNLAGLEPSSLTPPSPIETNIVGAYDPIIENGQPHAFAPSETFMLSAYRRSAIGLSADRSVLFFYASDAPINGPDMANQMIAMASEVWAPPIDVATNQDGGGSSQLYVQGLGQVIDSGRPVNTHLGVYASGAGPALNCPLTRSKHANAGVASWSPNRLDLFMRADGGGLQHKSFGSGWSDWEPLGTSLANQPVVSSFAGDRLDVLGRTPDGKLTHTYWGGSAWGTDVVATGIDSDPVMTSWGNDRIDAFVLAKDHTLDHFYADGVSWGHDSLGGDLAGSPAVTSWSTDRLDLMAVGTDGGMKHDFWDGTHWGAWESLPGNPASAISVTSWAPYRLDAFALAADHSVTHWYWGGAWGTDSLGGSFASPPAVASWGPGRLDVFAIAADHTLQHSTPVGYAWSAWENLGGSLMTNRAPQVVSWAPNRLDIFAEGTDRAMWHDWWDGTKWGTWENLGGTFPDDDPPSNSGSNGANGAADAGGIVGSSANANGGSNSSTDGSGDDGCNAASSSPSSSEAILFLIGGVLVARRIRRKRAR